jgi:hypothetical protein
MKSSSASTVRTSNPAFSNPTARRIVGTLNIAAGVLVLASIVSQIADKVVHNDFRPSEYFAYFTIQSSLINVVVLVVGGILAFRLDRDTVLYATLRVSIVAYAVITAVVYNALLRNIPYTGYHGIQWPNEVDHVWIPIFIVLEWLIAPGRPALRWTALRVVVIYPLAWLAFTMVRGAFTGWFPYPFLEPSTGFVSVMAYILGISAFIIGVASLAIWYSQSRARRALRR